MKKAIALLCVFVLTLSLCGCEFEHREAFERTKTADFSLIPSLSENFNNNYSFYDSFAASKDICFYSTYGYENNYLYTFYKGEKFMLLTDGSLKNMAINGNFHLAGDSLYFDTVSNEYDDYKYYIYRYNLPQKKYEQIYILENAENWTVTGKYIVYMNYYSKNDGFNVLYFYDTQTKRNQCVASEIEAFSVVNSKIRYISFDGKKYSLYEYVFTSNTSKVIAQFKGYSIKETVQYGFTENGIVMLPDTQNQYAEKCEYSIFDIKSDKTSKYTLPNGLPYFTAADNYAYIICEPDSEKEYDLKDYGIFSDNAYDIYRVNLASGKYELLDIPSTDYSRLYVVDDNEIYILNAKDGISGYNRKDTTVVYRFSATNKKSEKIFEYK